MNHEFIKMLAELNSIRGKNISAEAIKAQQEARKIMDSPQYLELMNIVNSDEYIQARKIYAQSPKIDNDLIKKIAIASKSIPKTEIIQALHERNSIYFSYEDVYADIYENLYLSISDDFVIVPTTNAENQENISVVSVDDKEIYPIENHKDIIGLQEMFKGLKKNEIIDFVNFLSSYPYLAATHNIGQRILELLQEYYNSSIVKLSIVDLYRGRGWSKKQEMDFNINQMWQPQYGTPPVGRFNPHGIPYLYMADSYLTAVSELRDFNKFTIIKAKLKYELNVLDISDSNCYVFELCHKRKSSEIINPNEYYIPNYIAQCCSYLKNEKNISIDGIKYKSSLNETGYCYVFFNLSKEAFYEIDLIVSDQ